MKNIFILFLARFLFLSICLSCDSNSNEEFNELLLYNCWTHSLEEDEKTKEQIYRLCDYADFPPSRFRERFLLEPDGNASILVIAANDAHFTVIGTWSFDKSQDALTIQNTDNELLLKKRVVELSEDKLVLESW